MRQLESGHSSVFERARGAGEVRGGCCEGVLFVAMLNGLWGEGFGGSEDGAWGWGFELLSLRESHIRLDEILMEMCDEEFWWCF